MQASISMKTVWEQKQEMVHTKPYANLHKQQRDQAGINHSIPEIDPNTLTSVRDNTGQLQATEQS